MRKFNDIAKKTGPNAGGVRMLALRSGFMGCAVNVAGIGYAPCTHLSLTS
ncbi:hypothetical protein GCM10025771_19310 [Niveibacterium umoris]|uniref:Uncharacterized protein n=1 Tax=Niveibacterium umoris TaxID=1193620 RepID=A0A840BH52_9RHOO|nr:hypothetical protein [Niveibacterium umoris]MBB4012881.1 hypothetical protein [Niveibacterium umoris]